MANDGTEELLNEIGCLLSDDNDYPLDGTLLHAEIERNVVGLAIFKELGNQILYLGSGSDRLMYTLLDLWEAQDGDSKWSEIEYLVRDGRFDVTYIYPHETDPDEHWNERRKRMVQRYFGDKPIVYPPDDDDDVPGYEV